MDYSLFKNAIIAGIIILVTPFARADGVQFEVGAGMAYFAGQQYKSLAPKTGYLLRFGAGSGRKNVFKWISNFSLLTSSGSTKFDDAGTYRELTYQMIGGEFNLGFKMAFLAGMEKLPVQPYMGAAGSVVAASFKFADDANVSETFPKTDAQNYYGYNIFVGTDIDIGREWGVNFHVEMSRVAGTLALKQFVLDSNRVFFQLFFRY